MNKAVLDTTIIVKGALTPYKSLPKEIYSRELGTHQKCRLVLNRLDESSVEVFIPKVCVIETAAVLRRLANRDLAAKLSRGLMRAYDLVVNQTSSNLPGGWLWIGEAPGSIRTSLLWPG